MTLSGGYREDVTPVPIPNTEVKSLIGEGTARFAGGRVARCRVFQELDSERSQALFFVLRKRLLEMPFGQLLVDDYWLLVGGYAAGLPV